MAAMTSRENQEYEMAQRRGRLIKSVNYITSRRDTYKHFVYVRDDNGCIFVDHYFALER
jgi:hypothetical protein